jgi:Chaperone of endosialidase
VVTLPNVSTHLRAGQLGTVSSSRRFKGEIKPMDNSSEAILGLKPVTFHYKTNKQNTPQFGLIAEEVAKANPDLDVHDENGEIYTVRYAAVNAMLLNEFLKEHGPSPAAESDRRTATEADRSSHYDRSASDRPNRPQQTCSTVCRQPLNSLVLQNLKSASAGNGYAQAKNGSAGN